MNTNRDPETDPLDRVLHQWKADASQPPRFQEQVWQRIASAETRPKPSLWPRVWQILEEVLPRPKFAMAYLSLILALGVAAGSVAAQSKVSRLDSELSIRYVQSVDPYRADLSMR